MRVTHLTDGRSFVYLDNAATTAVLPEVAEEMSRYFFEIYGNPSSSHVMGVEAARCLENARKEIAGRVGGGDWDVIFTGSGTEANNLAILGYAFKGQPAARSGGGRGGRIVTTAIEHLSVLSPCRAATSKGIELCEVVPSSSGTVDPERILDKAAPPTVLVSVQHANNEIGTIQPIEEIGKWIKNVNPEALLHVDVVQTAGKIDLSSGVARWADLLTISAHKIGGPKGIGALLVRKGLKKPSPLMWGGDQQWGVRPGTENVPAAAGLAAALKLMCATLNETAQLMADLERAFDEGFEETGKWRRLLRSSPHLPGFIVAAFEKVPSEVVEHAMEKEGFIVSSTAACSSRKGKRSHVLEAIGLPHDLNVIRIVPSRSTTPEQMSEAGWVLRRILERLI